MGAGESADIEKTEIWDAAEHRYRAQLKKLLNFFKAQ